jgi:biotin operon repressor
MSSKKDHEMMDNLDSCLSLVKQSSAKGISAQDLAKKLGKHRTTIHSYLTSLELRGQVESKHGLWYPREIVEKITNSKKNSTEKEIIIRLPLPKSDVNRMILLDNADQHFSSRRDNIYRKSIDRLEETRTIRIIGKNVDDLELQKIAEVVKEATESSYKNWFRNPFKKSKKSQSKNQS